MPSGPNPGERWEQVSHLYHAARARPASQRGGFLQEACAGDETLRQEARRCWIQWMTKVFDAHHVFARWAKVSPSHDVLRDDPRLDRP
jgi:hypothetical protein